MQLNQQYWCFALSGAPVYATEISTKPALLRRTLRRVGGQIIVLAFVLLDIASLAFAVVAPIWLAPWAAINVTVLMLGSLSWSEDRRIHRESTTAMQRQGIKVRAAEWRNIEDLKRKVQSQRREAERRQQQEEDEREAQKRLQAALRQAQEQLREAEQRRYRHKIKQCHPDRLGGLAPELLQLAEEQAKALNGAYANAMRTRRYAPRNCAAI
jgi:Skp family chaperone for outer membrane proteins